MIVSRFLFFGLVAVVLFQVAYFYPKMPPVMASHFDGLGEADGWSSRNLFFSIYLAVVALTTAVFTLLPRLIVNSRRFGLKLPNRDYWLSPQRLQHTQAFFCRQMMWMGVVHLLLAILVIQFAIEANLDQTNRLSSAISWALALYFLLLGGWLLHFYRHFQRTGT